MSELLFTISPEATSYLKEQLRNAQEESCLSGMLPVLLFAFDMQAGSGGNITEWCGVGFFHVGWYYPEQVSDFCLDEINLGDEMVYAFDDTLERLAGKTLVLETLSIGYPNPADKQEQFLRAKE